MEKINIIENKDILNDDWTLQSLKDMSNEQIIYVLHESYVDVINKLVNATNRRHRLELMFCNTIFNELCNRLGLENLKEIKKSIRKV